MNRPDYEIAEGLPSALVACLLNGEPAHITAISPRQVQLRTPEPIAPGASLELRLLQMETGRYISHTIDHYQTGEVRRHDGAALSRLFFDDPACAASIRRVLDGYARYVEIRSEYGASAYGEMLTGYPLDEDEIFHPSLDAQRRAWFESLPPLADTEGLPPIAVELNCPELWELYLRTPIEDFAGAYAACRYLPQRFLDGCCIDRLYVGNPFCSHLIPDLPALQAIRDKASAEGIALTIVSAYLRAGEEARADSLLDFAAASGIELAVNDWGMLERAHNHKQEIPLLLGMQLNRRRKDPRMKYKAGTSGREALTAQNSLNSPLWRQYLGSFGICRWEYESCAPASVPSGGSCSLHLPFYQTNTSLWCPLEALCMRADRGAQRPSRQCPGWCERNALLYPAHLNMIGRWNALMALDESAFERGFAGFDRIVLNF